MAGYTFGDLTESLKNLGKEYDRDIKSATSPFREEIKPEGANYISKKLPLKAISRQNNYYDLTTYQWYTTDIGRRYKDDYYTNIEVPFAKQNNNSSPGFIGTIITNATETVNNAKDTVVDSVNQITNSVDNLLNGPKPDPLANGHRDDVNKLNFSNYLKTFPYAKVYEFKPRDTLGLTVNALITMFKAIDSIIDTNGNMTDILKDMLDGVTTFLNKEFKIDIKNPKTFSDANMRIDGIPNAIYKNLISGYFTGYYEIPVLDYNGFLNVDGAKGWESQSIMQRFFTDSIASTVKGFMDDKIGSGFDIATRPKWSINGGGEGFPSITLELYLFNDTISALFDNLAFIHSYVGGNFWYQDTLIQKCSSLYDVEIPGRFRYYFCTSTIAVEYVGKVRQVVDIKQTDATNNIFLRWFNNLAGNNNSSPNLDVLNNVPDAYKVTITYQSLIPNNYNSYMSYITQNKNDQVSVGQTITSFYEKLAESVNAAATSSATQTNYVTEEQVEQEIAAEAAAEEHAARVEELGFDNSDINTTD